MAKGSADDPSSRRGIGTNVNVLDVDDWNEMYKDKEPSEWAGADRPMRRPHPMHPDDRPSTEYQDNDSDPGHDQYRSGKNDNEPELMGP